MYIYVSNISERIKYTINWVFSNTDINIHLCDEKSEFLAFQGPKFNYSDELFEGFLGIRPAALMHEKTIKNLNIKKAVFFKEECLSFNSNTDPFASIFYVLSRYEEYGVSARDSHNRFYAGLSVLSKYDWLQKLMCERWKEDILFFLNQGLKMNIGIIDKSVKFLPTFDIDNAFAFKYKPLTRRILSNVKDLVKLNFPRINSRRQVLKNNLPDPYDTFSLIEEISSQREVLVFWLLGSFSQYDKNLPSNNGHQISLIQQLANRVKIGIHPSYLSNKKKKLLHKEVKSLENILGNNVIQSRQHFLKLTFPETYRNLIEVGIEHDYSMGYADNVGFRAGTVRPFPWFDLEKNCETSLIIHPFSYMDGTLNEYLGLTVEQAKSTIAHLYSEIKNFGGEFSFIWHNETINDQGKWAGWTKVLDYTLSLDK